MGGKKGSYLHTSVLDIEVVITPLLVLWIELLVMLVTCLLQGLVEVHNILEHKANAMINMHMQRNTHTHTTHTTHTHTHTHTPNTHTT